jgi:hypothetical protein
MAKLNAFSFAGHFLNRPNVKVRQVTKGSPPLRGSNFVAPGRTGEIWTPKKHGGRMVSLEILVIDEPRGTALQVFDEMAQLAATRTQGALVQYLSSGARTAQAEIVNWIAQDVDTVGLVFVGQADFYLADPWFYGATVSGSVVPTAGIALGTIKYSADISGPRTTYPIVMTGVTSGQPILLAHVAQGATSAVSGIADTFATPYTWTKVESQATYQDVELWIGTGGVGTSGTITVTAASAAIGGMAQPFTGASTAAGLLAIDVHGHNSAANPGSGNPLMTLSLTPTAAGEAIVFVANQNNENIGFPDVLPSFPPGNILYGINYTAGPSSPMCFFRWLNPTSGAAFNMSVDTNPATGGWATVGAVLKGTGVPATLSVTNPGTVVAEKVSLDILGPLISPTISNLTNGTSVTVAVTVASTKHLLIDTGAFTALNDGANVVGAVSHTGAAPFLTLSPGVNVLQITGSGATGSSLVSVSLAAPYA